MIKSETYLFRQTFFPWLSHKILRTITLDKKQFENNALFDSFIHIETIALH